MKRLAWAVVVASFAVVLSTTYVYLTRERLTLVSSIDCHRGAIGCLAYSHETRLLASGGDDGTVVIAREDGSSELTRYLGHEVAGHPIVGIQFLDKGHLIASSAGAPLTAVWNPFTGEHQCDLAGKAAVTCLASSGDETLITGDEEGYVRFWNIKTALQEALRLPFRKIIGMHRLANNKLAVVGENRLVILDTAKRQVVHRFRVSVDQIDISPPGYLMTSEGTQVRSYRLADGELMQVATGIGHLGTTSAVSVGRNGEVGASCGTEGALVVWDLLRMRRLASVYSSPRTQLFSVRIIDDRGLVVVGGINGTLYVYRYM